MSEKVIKALGEKVIMIIPKEFERVSKDNMGKYFSNTVPDELYVVEEKSALISITKTDINFVQGDFDSRLVEYYELYSRTTANFSDSKIAKRMLEDNKSIGAFYYTSTSAETNWWNFFGLLSVDEKEVIITMHCDVRDIPIYANAFMKAINTLKVDERCGNLYVTDSLK